MKTIKVWDLFVRLSHWLIVLLVISAWLSSEFGDAEFKWHSWNGYALFILVFSRLIWGFVGSTTALYRSFIKAPWDALSYLRDLLTGKTTPKEAHYIGHNPAGGWMALMLWLVLITQAVTGMFASDDVIFDGPFSFYISSKMVNNITGIHHALFNLLILLVILHVLAVLYHQIIKKEKLIQAMLTGKKTLSHTIAEPKLIFRPFYVALIIVASVGATFWFILNHYG